MTVIPLSQGYGTFIGETFVPGEEESQVFVCANDECQLSVLARSWEEPHCSVCHEPMDRAES